MIISFAIVLFFSESLFPEQINSIIFRASQIDSIGHFIGFFILTWLVHSLVKLTLLEALITLSFYGALSELGQYYLGFRNGELSDFIADIVGISTFILLKTLYVAYKNALNKHINKKHTETSKTPRLKK